MKVKNNKYIGLTLANKKRGGVLNTKMLSFIFSINLGSVPLIFFSIGIIAYGVSFTLKELMSLDTAIEKAEQKIEYLSSDEETMKIYYERERSLHERANMISSAEKRGK